VASSGTICNWLDRLKEKDMCAHIRTVRPACGTLHNSFNVLVMVAIFFGMRTPP